jgi:hypothetical protein
MNSKSGEIFNPFDDDRDRMWAWRLEWAIKQNLDRAEDELGQLQDDFEAILWQSKDASESKYDQEHIADLYKKLVALRRSSEPEGFPAAMTIRSSTLQSLGGALRDPL